jgi:CHAT domain-containing protein
MRIVPLTACALLALAAAACDRAPRVVAERECVALDRGHPLSLSVSAPDSGTLRIGVEPRGIAIKASVLSSKRPVTAASPVDRLGLVTLVERVRTGDSVRLRVESRDWSGIRGEVCVSAHLLSRWDTARTRAERAFADAGAATQRREWQTAFDGYADAAEAYAKRGLAPLTAAAYHAMGELAYSRLSRESDALTFAARAAETVGAAGSRVERGALLALEARALLETRDLADPLAVREVRTFIAEARSLLASAPYGAREAARLRLVEGALAYRSAGRASAREHVEKAMEECRVLGDWECHAGAAQNIAVLAEEEESYQAALDAYEASIPRLDPAIAPELAADVWDNYGRLQRVAGLVMASEDSHRKALTLYTNLRNCDGVRRTLARLGALHAQVGSLADANLELRRAGSLDCEALFGSLAAADPPFDSRSASRPNAPCDALLDPATLSADGKQAVLAVALALHTTSLMAGDHAAAVRCAAEAPRFASTARARIRAGNATGETLLEEGKPKEARQAFEAAQREADAASIPAAYEHRGRTLLGLARSTLLAGNAAEAQRLGVRALQASAARADVPQTVDALRVLAASERELRDHDLALRTLRVAAQLVEQVPIGELSADVRATYLSSQHAVFADLTELTATAAKSEAQVAAAFAMAEHGRARSLKYAVSQTTERPDPGSDAAPYEKFLARLASAAERPESDAAKLIAGVAEAASSADPFARSDLVSVQRRLRELEAVLVQYAAGPREMFAFVIDPDGIHVHRLGPRDTLAAAAGALTARISALEPNPANVRDAARTLARHAWWPITATLRSKRVLIAPDDALHFVPFAVLPWSEAAGELTLHRAETSVVPSGTFVAQSRQARTSRGTLNTFALLGDPVFRSAPWRQDCAGAQTLAQASNGTAWEFKPSLPGTRDEVLGIATLVRTARPSSQVETLLGCEATAGALTRAAAAQPGVLHIATHGRIDAQRPRLSALAVTPDANAPEDASFGLLDILDLDLAARLVTLSACDTSQGRLLPGEGVLGPAQAFLEAGASTVVASSWRVEDETTARFMRAFYTRLLDRNMSAAAALRSTQLEEQSRGASYSWAAFGIYGRPDTRI